MLTGNAAHRGDDRRRSAMARFGVLLIVGTALLVSASAPQAADDPPDQLSDRIARLVEQLGDDDYFVRERAQAELGGLGFEAFDALEEAQNSEDIEIAARARYLMRKMHFDWASDGDPPEVRQLLKDYEKQTDAERVKRMEELVKLADDAGLAGLCRLVRFEQSPVRSKTAALKLIERPIPENIDWPRREQIVLDALRNSPRPGAQWLRTYLAARSDPAAAVDQWAQLARAEEEALTQFPDQTTGALVLALLRQQVDLFEKLERPEEAQAVMRRMLDLETGEDPQSLTELVEWLVRHQAWAVIDDLAARFSAAFDQNPLLLYTLAQAREAQGRHDLAEEVAPRALKSNPGNTQEHYRVAYTLRDRGLSQWAEREYQYVIDLGPPGNPYTLVSQWSLAEMLHDREAELEAARTLEPSVAAMEENLRQGNAEQNLERDPSEIRARMHYFFASHFAQKNDRAKQVEHLQAGIKAYPLDADVLIALYRLPEQTAETRAEVVEQIKEAAAAFRQQIAAATKDEDKSTACNQLAWLIGNTEGDQAEALRASQTSLELRPNEAGYLDTLARCYYAQGDLENAIKHQTQAVELEPHSGQMSRQLKFFHDEQARKRKP
jgi:Flp pilus assembly protein TadD